MFIYISFVMLFVVHFAASAQSDGLEARLNQYEALCAQCLELKSRVAAGETISKTQAQSQVALFLNMNKEIKACQSEMTPEQSARFAAIGQWFTSGVKPEILVQRPETQSPAVQSAATQSSDMRVSDTHTLAAKVDVVDPVVTQRPDSLFKKGSTLLLASISAPNMAYGVMVGYQYGSWGGYLSFRSNYIFGRTDYECNSDGTLYSGGSFWATGESRRSNLSVCLGGLMQVHRLLSVYVGAGYGVREIDWKDVDGNWAEVSDWTHKGFAAESGLMFSDNRLLLTAGVSAINFKTASFTCGIGVKF